MGQVLYERAKNRRQSIPLRWRTRGTQASAQKAHASLHLPSSFAFSIQMHKEQRSQSMPLRVRHGAPGLARPRGHLRVAIDVQLVQDVVHRLLPPNLGAPQAGTQTTPQGNKQEHYCCQQYMGQWAFAGGASKMLSWFRTWHTAFSRRTCNNRGQGSPLVNVPCKYNTVHSSRCPGTALHYSTFQRCYHALQYYGCTLQKQYYGCTIHTVLFLY